MREQIKDNNQSEPEWLEDYTARFYSESFWEYIVSFAEEFARANSEA